MIRACMTETPPTPVRNRIAAKESKLGAKHGPMPNEAIHVPNTELMCVVRFCRILFRIGQNF